MRPVHVFWFGLILTIGLSPARAEERIVTAGSALTEIVFALGAQQRLVGVDSTSRYPPQARQLPQIGYLRALSAEGILSLRPTLVLADPDAGPPDVFEILRGAGIRVKVIETDDTPSGVLDKITQVAMVLGLEPAGQRLRQRVADRFRELETKTKTVARPPRTAFFLHLVHGAPLAAGRNTAAAAMIALAGGRNIFSHRGYRPITVEALIAAAPEVVIVSDQMVDALGGMAELWRLPGMADTPAGRARRGVTMDASYLLGFGPRTPEAGLDLYAILHGENL